MDDVTAKKRMLAAIMFTDIVGYTSMMQENEAKATSIRTRHRAVFEAEHKNHFGEILQYYGDGTLSIFKSAVEAVQCAISMQQKFQSDNSVPLRIGLHLGDIVFDQNEVYGDGVNLASRIEGMGIPGSILLSDKLAFAVKNHDNILTQSLGHFEMKNIKEPVEVIAVCNDGLKIPDRAEMKGKFKEKQKSIAVLPFVNMSNDSDNEYFSDGISEEILNALVKVHGLRVTARTSSFSFKGKNMDVRDICQQLNVEHILEGSVRKAGNRVRITAQLINGVDGFHLFSENYDRTLEDIFAVQDEIASTITNKLREHLGEKEHNDKLVEATTTNLEAYETYLKGLYYFNQWEDESLIRAIPFFKNAIEMDPDFALSHARLALCYVLSAYSGSISPEEARNAGMKHIARLSELGAESAEAFFAEAIFGIFYSWDWPAAVVSIKKGLKAFPNYPSLHHALSTMYYISGDPEKLIKYHKTGYELDPMSIEMTFYMGIAYLWSKKFDKAMPLLNKVLKMVPNHRTALEYKAWIFTFTEDYDSSLKIFKNLEPEMGYRLHRSTCLGWVYFKIGELEKANVELDKLLALEPDFPAVSLDLATLYTGMEDFDAAFHYLEKAITNKIGDTMMARSDIFFEPLRADPRFRKLEEMIGSVPEIVIDNITTR